MKFSERSATERTAIGAWIRVMMMARENECLYVQDDFKTAREKSISEAPGSAGISDIEKMVRLYSTYQQGRHKVSYAEYFQVSNPEEYAVILAYEKTVEPGGAFTYRKH